VSFVLQCTSYLYYAWSKMSVFKDEWTVERLLIRTGNYMRRSYVWCDGCIDPNKKGNLFVFLDNITINPLRVARIDICEHVVCSQSFQKLHFRPDFVIWCPIQLPNLKIRSYSTGDLATVPTVIIFTFMVYLIAGWLKYILILFEIRL